MEQCSQIRSHSTTTSPALTMLDKLPSELIDHVLVLACPPTEFPDRSYCNRERRHILFTASLVSKRIKERAQALLWREVVVETDKEVAILTALVKGDEKKELMAKTRVLGGSYSINLASLNALASGFPELKEVQLVEFGKLESTDLEQLAKQSCAPFCTLPFPFQSEPFFSTAISSLSLAYLSFSVLSTVPTSSPCHSSCNSPS
jgi:hypothetical protein